MSIRAIAWVFDQDIRPSSVKFVAVALADNAGDTGEAWPSIYTIAQKTGQDRKTVIGALDRLIDYGIVEDTGRRMGSTNQVKVYRLKGFSEQRVPETVSFDNRGKESRFSRQTVPETGHGTVKEPSIKKSNKKDFLVPSDPLAIRCGALLGRRSTTPWTEKERAAYKKLRKANLITDEILVPMEWFYKNARKLDRSVQRNREFPYPRNNLITVFNHWPGEMDKSEDFCKRKPIPKTKVINLANGSKINTDDSSDYSDEEKDRRRTLMAAAKKAAGLSR